MTEPSEVAPTGSDQAEQAQAGDASRVAPAPGRTPGPEERPDLDARQRRVSTTRKPMGPPLRESGERRTGVPADADVPPTDPE